MEVQTGTPVDPATPGTPQGSGTMEAGTGGPLDGLYSGAGDKGSPPASASQPSGGKNDAAAGAAPGQGTPSANPLAPPTPKWLMQCKPDLQTHPSLSRFGDLDAQARAFIELEGKLGNAITMPGKDAKPEDWSEFYHRIGRPETADKYALEEIPYPDGLPPRNPEALKELKALYFEAGLPEAMAKRFYAKTLELTAQRMAANKAMQQQEDAACTTALKKEWGESYAQNLELARRLMTTYGDEGLYQELKAAGMTSSTRLNLFLGKVGRDMKEDSLVGAAEIGAGEKPGFEYKGVKT